ncbi:MAG: MaoC family dehydratase N-terminal domain-containing protein [Chloroflexota bacterium]
MTNNQPDFSQWIGRQVVHEDFISATQANLMNATINRDPAFQPGDPLPPAWHWLFFHDAVPLNGLGVEGHPKLGGFMPPVSLPRRMWAGGSLQFERPITIGETATKRSHVTQVEHKVGRSGELYFVTVEHELFQGGSKCLHEKQTIVYREPTDPTDTHRDPPPAPEKSEFSAEIQPSPTMLFRYSALTFNGHRIHYDADFCREHEGYPNLVFHGPLTATLLLDLFYRKFQEEQIKVFEYRGVSPLFNPDPFTIHGTRKGKFGKAWATNPFGGLAMQAQITY